MQQRVDFITLGVPDLDAARRFYVDGLGWKPTLDIPGEITFIQVGHGQLFGIWGIENLADDVGAGPFPGGPPPLAFAHNVGSDEEVVELLARAERAGATILKPGQRAAFGGFHGYFADPSGFRWEIAHNPGWSVDADGVVSLGLVEG
jgi:catechol 2,3-dioxygenase-like lactoylglutathione lyase family enzyme